MYLTGMKKTVANKVLGESEAVKWCLSLRLHFHKANEPSIFTDPLVVFRTEVFISVNVGNVNAMFTAASNELVQQIDDYHSNWSGWVVDQFIDVDLSNTD